MEKKIMVIDNQKDMKKLSKKLGVREDWHEPDESGVEAVVRGKTFDNAGFWGSAFEKSNAKSDTKCACEKYVQIRQYGEPVAEVNLATLCAIAAGTMDEDLDEKLEKIKLRRWYRGEIQIQGKDVKFNWGPVKNIHTVGEYDIIEYEDTDNGKPNGEILFHPYIKGRDTNHSYESLEEAMAGMIAIRMDGWNTRADRYFIAGIKDSTEAIEV